MEYRGIDVSAWQGEIDWKKVDEKVAEWKMEGQSFLEIYCNEAY